MTSSLAFTVRRREPELVAPAEPTTHEFKPLSEMDAAPNNRVHVWGIHFYGNNPSMERRNPSCVIREALAKALTFYYPFAGRLREVGGGKLVVECTGEGAVLVEADADVRLEQFGDDPRPPFPCLEELLYEAEGYDGLLDSPLLLIQVTRLRCGGLVFAYRFNHIIADGPGILQFIKGVAEMARGADAPTVLPVWERELLNARTSPRVTHVHTELDLAIPFPPNTPIPTQPPADDMLQLRSFFLGPREMSALRRHLPAHRRSTSSRFEVVTACAWRCRTIALGYDPGEQVRLMVVFNARSKSSGLHSLPLPVGFYGNAFVAPVGRSSAGELCRNTLDYALERVREVKASVTDGYFQSLVDAGVLMGRPLISTANAFVMSDLTRARFDEVDFGWGRPVYAGPALPPDLHTMQSCFLVRHKNKMGEEGTLMALCLPAPAMERFTKEMGVMTKEPTLSAL